MMMKMMITRMMRRMRMRMIMMRERNLIMKKESSIFGGYLNDYTYVIMIMIIQFLEI